jgi:hypothetical protein
MTIYSMLLFRDVGDGGKTTEEILEFSKHAQTDLEVTHCTQDEGFPGPGVQEIQSHRRSEGEGRTEKTTKETEIAEFSLNIISRRKVATNVVLRRLCGHLDGRFSHSFLASDCNATLGACKESIGL